MRLLSRSTPGYRFDAPAPSPAAAENPSVPETVDAAAAAFVADAIADAREPVVLFALEWCEFCWSLRRLFARLGIPFRSVDLDSVSLQRDDLGGRIRTALAARTGAAVIPVALQTSAWSPGKLLKDYGPILPARPIRFAFGESEYIGIRMQAERLRCE